MGPSGPQQIWRKRTRPLGWALFLAERRDEMGRDRLRALSDIAPLNPSTHGELLVIERAWIFPCAALPYPTRACLALARPHIARFQAVPDPAIARPPDDSGGLASGVYRSPLVFKRKRAAHDVWTALQATHMHGRAAMFSAPCPTFPKPDRRRAPRAPGRFGRTRVHGRCRPRWCGAQRPCRCRWPQRRPRRTAR